MRSLDNFEKLLVLMTASIGADPQERALDLTKVSRWVASGDEWALSWEYDYFDDEKHPLDEQVNETSDILYMYWFLQNMAPDVLEEAGLVVADLEFPGFDGNDANHFHIAKVMIEDLKRHVEVTGGLNNSHGSVDIDWHRAMLNRFKKAKGLKAGSVQSTLSAEDIRVIVGK